MTHETNPPVSQQIDEICDQFEAALKTDLPLNIEECLAKIDAEHQASLFRELLEIELELLPEPNLTQKERQGRYESRFPGNTQTIDAVFRRVLKPDRIGGYEILEELGHGGMGVVYKARQDGLSRVVALKILPESLLHDEQAVKRFQRETRLIGQLKHPNVVIAHDAGEVDGVRFIAMEYVNGVNLQQFVAQLAEHEERLPLGVICELVRQAALGLQHAHESELVHRDIKPANLMLDYSGTVKLLDLGLGKFFSEKLSEDSHVMTRIGATMGTPDYMSPEQCQVAKDVDIRSDIYSLGCTFYFLATGRPPYHGERFDTLDKKMMGHIVVEPPRLGDEIPETPPELEEIFQMLLAKKSEQRFQTPLELADALEPFADSVELREWLDLWKHEHGIASDPSMSGVLSGASGSGRVSGRSTNRISAKSTKKHVFGKQAKSMSLPHLARDWRVIVALLAIVVLVAALLPFVPHKKTMSPEFEQARLDFVQLPGLNGRWWFEEIPWFIPPVREQLMRKLDKNPNLLGNDPKKICYDANVSHPYEWLRETTKTHILNDLTVPQRELVTTLMKFSDTANADTDIEKSLVSALTAFEAAHDNGSWSAVDMHTRANLKHRIAAKTEKTDLVEDAVKCYEEAAKIYNEELKKSEHLYPLAVLCRADGLRIEYAMVAKKAENKEADVNYDTLFDRFEDVCVTDKTHPFGLLFEVEFRTMFGAYCAEAGKFPEAEKQFRLANKALEECKADNTSAHPLKAHIAERHAWCLMDMWRVTEARKLFGDAWRYRTNYYDLPNIDKSKANDTVDYYILHNRHALAMATRYTGDSEGAERSYAAVQNEVDKKIEDFKNSPQSRLASRQILSDLKERAGNTRERRADCILYSGAASGIGRERFADMAELYRQAGEYYEPESMKRVMRLKQAIMLMLLGGEELSQGEKILQDAIAEENEKPLSGNQVRFQLMRQLADAVLAIRKTNEQSDESLLQEKYGPMKEFLKQFPYQGNFSPVIPSDEAKRRENLEMRFFAAELLLNDLLAHDDESQANRDLLNQGRLYLDDALAVLHSNKEFEPFLQRFIRLSNQVRNLPMTGTPQLKAE